MRVVVLPLVLGLLLGAPTSATAKAARAAKAKAGGEAAKAAPVDDRRPIVLAPLRPLGVDAEIAKRLDQQLRAEIERLPGLRVVDRAATEAALAKAAEGCEGEPACLAEVARGLSAGRAVSGVAAELGASYVVTLKLVDAAQSVESARISERFQGTGDELLAASRAAAYRLLAPERYVGELEVRVPVEGALVRVDGVEVGRTPLPAPIGNLRPGTRSLEIAYPGFDDVSKPVEVRFQRRLVVTVDLEKGGVTAESRELGASSAPDAAAAVAKAPHEHAIAPWMGVAAGAVFVSGLVVSGVASSARSEASERCDPAGACTRDEAAALADRADRIGAASKWLYGGAALLGLATAGVFLFEEPDDGPTIVPTAAGAPAGASLLGRF